jgi:rare lipoprotein A
MATKHLLSLAFALWLPLGCLPGQAGEANVGLASFYAQVPDPSQKFTAAHRTLPFGTMVSVVRVDNGAQTVVRVNDRGPFIKGRIIDLSVPAAQQLGMTGQGLARVKIQVIPRPVLARKRAGAQGAVSAEAAD